MSVYIKGMEMPTNCCQCPLTYYEDGTCIFTGIEALSIGIQKDCPLVPVPDHGRLIDADALKNTVYEALKDAIHDDNATSCGAALCAFIAKHIVAEIESAPTIIPADPPVMYYPQVDGITPTIIPADNEEGGLSMSGIYIPGMEIPTEGFITVTITSDGRVVGNSQKINGKFEYLDNKDIASAIPVPDHGDLIDREALEKDIDKYIGGEESRSRFHHWVQVQSVVIPGDKGEEA